MAAPGAELWRPKPPLVPRLTPAKLRARSVPVEYMVAANEGHSLDRRETRLEALSRIALFLERNLTAR